jgi:hypothetical protein
LLKRVDVFAMVAGGRACGQAVDPMGENPVG